MIPLIFFFLQSFRVSNPIVGKSTLKSWFFFGNFIKTPFEFLGILESVFLVPSLISLAIIFWSLIINAWTWSNLFEFLKKLIPFNIDLFSLTVGFILVKTPEEIVSSGLNVFDFITLIFSLSKISIIDLIIAASPFLVAFIILGIYRIPFKSNFSDESFGLFILPAKRTFLDFFFLLDLA